MPNRDEFRWFKDTFHAKIQPAIAGTPFTLDLLTAIAAQETGHIWGPLHGTLDLNTLLAICVGDTLDADKGRRAFPKTKAELIAVPRGEEMFDIAREALVQMAAHVPAFQAVSKRRTSSATASASSSSTCSSSRPIPIYFLDKRWFSFDVVPRQVRRRSCVPRRSGPASGRTDVADRPRAGARGDRLQRRLVRRRRRASSRGTRTATASSTAS